MIDDLLEHTGKFSIDKVSDKCQKIAAKGNLEPPKGERNEANLAARLSLNMPLTCVHSGKQNDGVFTCSGGTPLTLTLRTQ